MSVHVHELNGCVPTPLAHYLKALGVLRLIAEQCDSDARGAWRDERFVLVTRLDREALLRFFLQDYAPTPLVAPWNGGSGFYPKDNRTAIEAIATSSADRFGAYRDAIRLGQSLVANAEKSPKDDEKTDLLARMRAQARGGLLMWLDAAFVLPTEGRPSYPPMLGTGGNDGRLDYTNNFMQRLVELLDCTLAGGAALPGARDPLEFAMFGVAAPVTTRGPIGQFIPGGAGGANATDGYEGAALFNPWDFVLMLEGCVAFASSVTRRGNPDVPGALSAPFVVRSTAAGYASAADVDEEKGRGEQWMPLWSSPATWSEVAATVAEGRCQVRRSSAARPAEVARAIGRLGVARGLYAFERFGYAERLGQNKLAIPLGRWQVRAIPHIELVDEIAPWIDALRRAAGRDHAPASFARVARACDDALLACCGPTPTAAQWQHLLLSVARAEQQALRSPRFAADASLDPIPPLSTRWLSVSDDGRPEIRLAFALAQQWGVAADGSIDWSDPVRGHFAPLARGARHFERTQDAVQTNPDVVIEGVHAIGELGRLVERRARDERRATGLPLRALAGSGARISELAAWLAGQVDSNLVVTLARSLCAVRIKKDERPPWRIPAPSPADVSEVAAHGLLALAVRAGDLPRSDAPRIPCEERVVTRLAAGDLAGAIRAAARRVASSDLRPHFRFAHGDARRAARHLAALAFPIAPSHFAALRERIVRPSVDASEHASTSTDNQSRTKS